MKPAWSTRNRNPRRGKALLLKGTAYPHVVPGQNRTQRISAQRGDRRGIYHDPAVQLSESDLNGIDGGAGAPICYNHDVDDVIGTVRYSWLREEKNGRQPLEIVASLPLDAQGRVLNRHGKDVRAEIEAKLLRGFSVRYLSQVAEHDPNLIEGKLFREISLVPRPFFPGCDLTVAVVAGKGIRETALASYYGNHVRSPPLDEPQFVPFTMEGETAAAPPASPAPTDQAADLLRQTELLAQQRQEQDSELETLRKQIAEERRLREQAEKAKETYARSVVENAQPLFEKFKKHWETTQGKEMNEQEQQAYMDTFANPAAKESKAILIKEMEAAEAQRQHAISVAASLEEMKKELDAAKEERKKLTEHLAKATAQVPPTMRAAYARAVEGEASEMSEATESAAKQFTESSRRTVGVAAGAEDILVPAPNKNLLPFLRRAGVSSQSEGLEVVAGEFGEERTLRPLLRSLPKAPEHDLLVNKETGERNFPASKRYNDPVTYSWLTLGPLPQTSNSELANYVQPRAVGNFVELPPGANNESQ